MRAWVKLVVIKPERREQLDLKDVTKEKSDLKIQIWLNIWQVLRRTM